MKRAIILTVLVVPTGWLAASASVWLYARYYRKMPEIHLVDIMLPGRWEQFREKRGKAYLAQADVMLSKGEFQPAITFLRVGLAKAPASPESRIQLAQLYQKLGRADLARDTLVEGLRFSSRDFRYLKHVLLYLYTTKEESQLKRITQERLQSGNPTQPAERALLASYAALLAYDQGDGGRAESILREHGLEDSVDGIILRARISCDRDRPDTSVLLLKNHLAHFPDQEAVRAELAECYRLLRRDSEREALLVEDMTRQPYATGPRIRLLEFLHEQKAAMRVSQECESFLKLFAREPAALLELANFAATAARPEVARQVRLQVAGQPERLPATLMLAEAELTAGHHSQALDLLTACTMETTPNLAPPPALLDGLRVVALCGAGRQDEARLVLVHLLAQPNLPPGNLVILADRLHEVGAGDLSKQVLARAADFAPAQPEVYRRLVRLALAADDAAALADHLPRYLGTRRPSREILEAAAARLGSDRYLFQPRQEELLAAVQSALRVARN